jgi:hypothetical protein
MQSGSIILSTVVDARCKVQVRPFRISITESDQTGLRRGP